MKKMFDKQLHSFYYAFKGLASVLKTESHMRFHLVAAIYVIAFSAKFYSLSSAQWALLMLTIAAVFITETINTAIERLCDTITTEYSKNIGFVKDVCAGAVLVSAICAVVVAFIILFRVDVFNYIIIYFAHHIFELALLIAGSVLAVLFIVTKPETYLKKFCKSADDDKTENKDNIEKE